MGCTSRLSLRALILAVALTATIFTAFVFGGTDPTPNSGMTSLDEQVRVALGISEKYGSAPAAPAQSMRVQFQELGSLWMSETEITDVEVIGNYAFAVGAEPGFMVFDISNPASPQRVAWLRNTAALSYGIAIERNGSYLYLFGGTDPVLIMDVSDPLTPVRVGSFTPPDNGQPSRGVTAMAIQGQYLYLVLSYGDWDERDGDLIIASLTSPTAPTLVGSVPHVGLGYAFRVSGEHAFVGRLSYYVAAANELVAINVSDPANPLIVGMLATSAADTSGAIYDIAVVGQRAYLSLLYRGLMVVDIADPSAMTQVGFVGNPNGFNQMRVDGSTLFVSKIANGAGLLAYDITNQDAPALLGEWATTGSIGRLSLADGRVYVSANDQGFRIVDVSNPATMVTVAQWSTKGSPADVVFADGRAYIADGRNGLVILDVSDPAHIDTLGTCSLAGQPVDIALYGTVAYVATFDGLVAIDVSDPGAPVATWGTLSDGDPQEVAITGHYLFSAAFYDGVNIYDISNPRMPVRVRQVNTLGWSWGIVINGNYAYVADYANGVLILDITEPTDPYIVGRVPAPQHDYECGYWRIAYVNGYVYASASNDFVHIIDVADPSAPVDVGTWYDGSVGRMIVSGNRLFMVGPALWLLDVTNPLHPYSIGYHGRSAAGVAIGSGLLYVTGFPGLTVMAMNDYFCGDVDNSLALPDIGDLSFFVDFLFAGGPAPANLSAGNVDGSGNTDIADLTLLVDYLFFGQGTLNCF